MNSLKIFSNPQFGNVQGVLLDDEVWFIAKEISDILGFRDPYTAARCLDDDEKKLHTMCVAGQMRETTIISEAGLYSLIIKSRKDEAKKFKRWVTHEVIPSIRQYGAYMTPAKLEEVLLSPDTIIQLAQNLKAEQERRQEAERLIQEQQPKVLFAESVTASEDAILVRDLAKVLRQNGVDIGEKRLFEWLRANGYLIKSGRSYNMPTQRSMDLQLFEVKERVINTPDGKPKTKFTPLVTGRGQIYFVNKLLSKTA